MHRNETCSLCEEGQPKKESYNDNMHIHYKKVGEFERLTGFCQKDLAPMLLPFGFEHKGKGVFAHHLVTRQFWDKGCSLDRKEKELLFDFSGNDMEGIILTVACFCYQRGREDYLLEIKKAKKTLDELVNPI